jgi:hypothetical protein
MPRRLRIEFDGAIDHVMARGNARQKIVRDDADRRRLIDGLEQSVVRHGWDLLSYVVMGNHLHLAWLCRRHTEASLRELAASLGLSRPDSVPNLTRRIDTRLKTSPELSNDLAEIPKRTSSPDASDDQAIAKLSMTPRQSPRPKTKKQG